MIHLHAIVSFKNRVSRPAAKTQSLDLQISKTAASANLPSMNNARDPAQDGQADVDQEIRVAPCLEEDGERGLCKANLLVTEVDHMRP